MNQPKLYRTKDAFDPCYGFKVLLAGEQVHIQVASDGDIRMVKSETEGAYAGWGYRLSSYELQNNFKEVR